MNICLSDLLLEKSNWEIASSTKPSHSVQMHELTHERKLCVRTLWHLCNTNLKSLHSLEPRKLVTRYIKFIYFGCEYICKSQPRLLAKTTKLCKINGCAVSIRNWHQSRQAASLSLSLFPTLLLRCRFSQQPALILTCSIKIA